MLPEVSSHVQEQVMAGNPWYVGSQFEWAARPHMVRLFEKRRRFVLRCVEHARMGAVGTLRILDAGCGDGYWLHQLSSLSDVSLTGIDYNPLRVERARLAVPAARVDHGDLTSYQSESPFNLILLSQVLEHIKDDLAILRRMRDLLSPAGVLILGTPNEGTWLQKRIRSKPDSAATDHVNFYTENALRAKLVTTGFRVAGVMREPFYLLTDRWTYRLMRSLIGFRFLELLSVLLPGGCTDFYFECTKA